MGSLLQDLRFGWRTLCSRPGFTFVAVLTLALGIGANTAIFSVVEQVLLQPLPYAHPEQLVHIGVREQWLKDDLNAPQNKLLADQSPGFQSVATVFPGSGCNLVGGSAPVHVARATVSASFFGTLGVQPMLGRDFLPPEAVPMKPDVAILSYGGWRDHFGSDPKIVGRQIRCNGESLTLIGVLPNSFRFADEFFGSDIEVWVPNRIENFIQDDGDNYSTIARLKTGLTVKRAEQQLEVMANQLAKEQPQYRGMKFVVQPYQSWLAGGSRMPLLLLLGAVTLVLLIAAANVSGLLLARASVRQREMAIRTAIGASQSRIVRQLLTEGVLLGTLGGIAGLILALWSADAVRSTLPIEWPLFSTSRLQWPVLLFALVISFLVGVIASLAPALQASAPDLSQYMKQGDRGSGRSRLRQALVVLEVSLALTLLVGSTLLIKGFLILRSVSPGIDPTNVQVTEMSLASDRYNTSAAVTNFEHQVLARVEKLPGVVAAATTSGTPGHRTLYWTLRAGSCEPMSIQFRAVSPRYLATMSIPLRRGRMLTEQDENSGAPVTLINETLANRCWPGHDALGAQVVRGGASSYSPAVVGIVGDTRDFGLARDAAPTMYVVQSQVPDKINQYANSIFSFSVVTRTTKPIDLSAQLREAVLAADPEQPVMRIVPASEILGQTVQTWRVLTQLTSIFAGLALTLTAIGIYGLLSYVVAQRTREIGIRLALGALEGDVLWLVVRQSLALVAVGVVVGLVGAVFATRFMSGMLFGVRPGDPMMYGLALSFLVAVALIASYAPARRASRVDPMVALRNE